MFFFCSNTALLHISKKIWRCKSYLLTGVFAKVGVMDFLDRRDVDAIDDLEKERDLFLFRNALKPLAGEAVGPSRALCRILDIWCIIIGVGFSKHWASLARITASLSSSNL